LLEQVKRALLIFLNGILSIDNPSWRAEERPVLYRNSLENEVLDLPFGSPRSARMAQRDGYELNELPGHTVSDSEFQMN
jgi:hypothetical protein